MPCMVFYEDVVLIFGRPENGNFVVIDSEVFEQGNALNFFAGELGSALEGSNFEPVFIPLFFFEATVIEGKVELIFWWSWRFQQSFTILGD